MKISVVIPTWNRRKLIQGAVDSVLAQSVTGLELDVIVVDDRSSDGTVEFLQEAYADKPVTVLINARAKGPAGARNTGLLAAEGDLVALLDSDDAYLEGHLSAAADAFSQHPALDVLFGRALYEQDGAQVDYMGPHFERKLALAPVDYQDDSLLVFGQGYFSHLLENGCYFNLSTIVMRREAARELMREELRIAEDYEFWVRLARSRVFGCLKARQIRYTLHDSNVSFETTGQASDNAPMQLHAFEMMLGYENLSRADTARIRKKMAEILFNWAYRCRLQHQFSEAVRLHLQSMRYGMIGPNLSALAKIPLFAVLPSRVSNAEPDS